MGVGVLVGVHITDMSKCHNAGIACNKIYCILSSKTYSTMSSLLQLPAGSQQAATSARIFETRLLMSESRDFYIIVCNLISMKKHLYKYLLWSILFWIYVSAHIMAGYIVCSAVFFLLFCLKIRAMHFLNGLYFLHRVSCLDYFADHCL